MLPLKFKTGYFTAFSTVIWDYWKAIQKQKEQKDDILSIKNSVNKFDPFESSRVIYEPRSKYIYVYKNN